MANYSENCSGDEWIYNPDCVPPAEIRKALYDAEKTKLLTVENKLKKKIIGQDAACSAIGRALRRAAVGLKKPEIPIAVLFFLGPTGTGKSQICKNLADILGRKLIKLDMSEFYAKHEVSRLTGSSPGYIGHESGGQLTNAIRANPNAVLLIDEIEKASPGVFNIFLQIFEGNLTSGKGEAVSFSDTIIIITSNIGCSKIDRPIGFNTSQNKASLAISDDMTYALKKAFKPEFLNRITEFVEFNTLSENDVFKICKIMLNEIKSRAKKSGTNLIFDKTAIKEIARLGYSQEFGARFLSRQIEALICDPIADKILSENTKPGIIYIKWDNGNFEFETAESQLEKCRSLKSVKKTNNTAKSNTIGSHNTWVNCIDLDSMNLIFTCRDSSNIAVLEVGEFYNVRLQTTSLEENIEVELEVLISKKTEQLMNFVTYHGSFWFEELTEKQQSDLTEIAVMSLPMVTNPPENILMEFLW
ncbi:MAG: AAA family ATPase [Oscillospiraceae bacterium]|nr:AAA family ATPase [Oscillospiraceae bacterium]